MSDYTDSLRQLADFLDANPVIPVPPYPDVDIYLCDDESIENVSKVARSLGVFNKVFTNYGLLYLERMVGIITLRAIVNRDSVCTKRIIGTKTITKKVLPEGVEMITKEIEEDIVEWDCPPSLLSASQ